MQKGGGLKPSTLEILHFSEFLGTSYSKFQMKFIFLLYPLNPPPPKKKIYIFLCMRLYVPKVGLGTFQRCHLGQIVGWARTPSPPPWQLTSCHVKKKKKIQALAAHQSNVLSKNTFSAPMCCLEMYCNPMWNSATLTSKINYNNEH